MQTFSQALSQDLAALAAHRLPPTPTGRPAYKTRKRRPQADRPRIARRFVPRHSVGIVLDWDLSSSERVFLIFLLSLPRDGAVISGQSVNSFATQLGVDPRTVRRWLQGLEEFGYIVVRRGRLRGSLVITLTRKATRWCQLRDADFKPKQKKPKPSQAPNFAGSRTLRPTLKEEEKKERKEAAREEGAAVPAWLLAHVVARAKATQGTRDARYWQQTYVDLLEKERRRTTG